MDRNFVVVALRHIHCVVALRKESVDRNIFPRITGLETPSSLSARRAWIEMRCWRHRIHIQWSLSARRAWIEIKIKVCTAPFSAGSLSARRAWIEIYQLWQFWPGLSVALRKESVDRNACFDCGSKQVFKSLSARRAWIEIGRCSAPFPGLCPSLSARRAWIEILTSLVMFAWA